MEERQQEHSSTNGDARSEEPEVPSLAARFHQALRSGNFSAARAILDSAGFADPEALALRKHLAVDPAAWIIGIVRAAILLVLGALTCIH